jgi:protein ImuB
VRFDLQPSFEDFQLLENLNRQKPAAKRYSQTLTLPVAMRDSKMLLRLLRLQLESDPPQAPIQKIVLAADSATPRAVLGGLFVPAAPDPEKLELTLARLMKLVGHGNVGSPSLLDSHRPGHFQMEKFRISSEASEKQRENPSLAGERKPQGSSKPMAGFRVLRPSLSIDVEWLDQQPMRVRIRGMCGDVVAASGPWRSSGEWWQEDAWNQNEWDLAIEFGSAARPTSTDKRKNQAKPLPEYGIYRVYYDVLRQSWFVRGVSD